MTNKIIILGSSRSFGETRHAVNEIIGESEIELIDLKILNIAPYDYEYQNQDDDFLPTILRVLEFETIIIATPVYWYSMSSHMKIFIDRITDLLAHKKDLVRQLRGKKLFVIASFGTSYPEGFESTFAQTCKYLGINYLGTSFIYSGSENTGFTQNNIEQIEKARKVIGIKT